MATQDDLIVHMNFNHRLCHHPLPWDRKLRNDSNWCISNKLRNKNIKSINGNGKNSINFVNWNLGPRLWRNKVEEIQLLVDDFVPDIAFIAEANIWNDTTEEKMKVEGYNIVLAPTMANLDYVRLVALIKEDFVYKIEKDLHDNDISSLWIRIGGRGRRSIFVGGIYREHTLLGHTLRSKSEVWSTLSQQVKSPNLSIKMAPNFCHNFPLCCSFPKNI